jgi:hypothetical protein
MASTIKKFIKEVRQVKKSSGLVHHTIEFDPRGHVPAVTSVWTLLESLPKEPAKIAALLRKKAVSGVKQNLNACPLANYIMAESVGVADVQVNHLAIDVRVPEGDVNISYQIPTPPHVFEFMHRFDKGKYKGL